MHDANRQQTLCWECAKATGGCCWSDHWKHEPVPGWTAEESMLKVSGSYITSYCVKECPEFEPDRRRK